MSLELGCQIPEILKRDLQSDTPPRVAVPLVSLDPEGFPHVALLSFFEILVHGEEVFFYLLDRSGTCQFLERRPPCLLVFVRSSYCLYVKGEAALMLSDEAHCLYALRLSQVLSDRIPKNERETHLLSGTRFHLSRSEEARRLALREKLRRRLKT